MTPYFVVGLGSNLGSREALLRAGARLVAQLDGARVLARSRLYLSAPVGPPQPDYLNAALRVESEAAPLALLDALLDIERALGRVRRERWGPRTLDLDLLAWSGGAYAHPRLTLPHPRLAERPFALAPLADVAPASLPVDAAPLEGLEVRAWTEARPGEPVEALDAADAWALAAQTWWGAPARIARVEPLRCPADALPASPTAAQVALASLGEDEARGWRLVGHEPARCPGPARARVAARAVALRAPELL